MIKVTLQNIRSMLGKKEKISMERAVELIKADRGHAQYDRNTIKKVLKLGVLVQLNNCTLQIVGVGINAELRPKDTERECLCWKCVTAREQLKKNSIQH